MEASDEFLNLSQSPVPYLQIVDAKIIYPNIVYYKIKIDSQCNEVLNIIIINSNSN